MAVSAYYNRGQMGLSDSTMLEGGNTNLAKCLRKKMILRLREGTGLS